MSRVWVLFAVAICVLGTDMSFSQPAPSDKTVQGKSLNEKARERRNEIEAAQAAKQKEREAFDKRTEETVEARSRKRADCRRQAKEQGLHWMKRVRFIRKCMADSASISR